MSIKELSIALFASLYLFSFNAIAKDKVYIVPLFENFSQYKSKVDYEVNYNDSKNPSITISKEIRVDQYSEVARTLLQDWIVNMGLKTVERKRVDQILAELGLTNQAGYVNEQAALEAGQSSGANTIVMGSIVGFQFKHEKVRAYGINQDFKVTLCKVRVRLIDVESGRILFSTKAEGKFSVPTSDTVENEVSDRALTALEDAIDELSNKESFVKIMTK